MRALPINKTSRPGGRPRKDRAPRNAFADWLMSSKKSAEDVATELGVGTSTVYNIRNGYFLPGLDLANKIAEVSRGKVPTSTWKGAKTRPRVRKASKAA